MKVFIIGSRKFHDQIGEFVHLCRLQSIDALLPGKDLKSKGEEESKSLLEAFGIIKDADLVYVFAENGYLGLTGAIELGFTLGLEKTIVSSEVLGEKHLNLMINRFLTPDQFLLEYGN